MNYFEEPPKETEEQPDLFNEKSPAELAVDALNEEIFTYNQTSLSNFKALLNKLLSELADPELKAEVDLDAQFDLKIRLRGESWTGEVDKTVAKIILKYQDQLDLIYSELCEHRATEENPIRIRVKVEEGCSIFDFSFDKSLKEIFSTMDDKTKKIIFISAILTVGGCYLGSKALSVVKDIQVAKIETTARAHTEETFKEMSETQIELAKEQFEVMKEQSQALERVTKTIFDAKSAPKYIIKQMKPEDTIQLPTDEAPVPKEAAMKRYVTPRITTPDPKRENIFDTFIVVGINFKDPHEPILSLECNGHAFPATLEIVTDENAGIAEEVKDGLLKSQRIDLPLNVHVFHQGGDVEKAKVLGMGEAVKGARPIDEVLGTAK
jgi:hypothetical protein